MKKLMRRGFTLVELLVIIAIIGVIVGMLFPAVQAAREASRRAVCTSNLRQIALATINYQETHKAFPPGCIHFTNPKTNEACETGGVGDHSVDVPCGMIGWPAFLLPFLEAGDTLYRDIDFSQPAYADYCGAVHVDEPCPNVGTAHQGASRNCPSLFRCPTVPHVAQSMKGMKDYAANGAVDWPERVNIDARLTDSQAVGNRAARMGVFYRNSGIRLTDIKDGSSHTFLFLEQSAMSFPEATSPTEFGANPFFFVNQGSQGFAVCYIYDGNAASPNSYEVFPNALSLSAATRGPRSFHVVGLNSAFGDGSVKYIRETIHRSIWEATFTRSQGHYDYIQSYPNADARLQFGGGLKTAETLR